MLLEPRTNFRPLKIAINFSDIEGQTKPDNNADVTGDSMNGKYVVVAVGKSIQKAIDLVNGMGGGVVALKNGTHTPGGNITVPSGVYIQGLNGQSCIVDFASAAYGFIFTGSNNYATGTCSITKGSTTLTGVGTVWTSAMVGRSVLLDGIWYPIAARVSDTQLTLAVNYAGTTLSGSSYTIATTVHDVKISDLTIQNSTTAGIKIQYCDWFRATDVNLVNCAIGVDIDDSSKLSFDVVDPILCATSFDIDNAHFIQFMGCGSVNTASGNAFEFTNCTNFSLSNCFALNSVGDGMQFTSCSNGALNACNSVGNGGQGYELISGNNSIKIISCGAINNTSDGIKLTATSDNCAIIACVLKDNGGWGINIAASTDDNTAIKGNQYTNNTSGDITDSGTNTNGGSSEEDRVIDVIASDTLRTSADTERNKNNDSTMTLVKEIKVRYSGTYRVKFDAKKVFANGQCQVYKNGVASGTLTTISSNTYTTTSEDLVFSKDDLVQLYYKSAADVAAYIYAKNFRLYFTKSITTDTTVNTD